MSNLLNHPHLRTGLLVLPSCPSVRRARGAQRVCAPEQVCPMLWGFVHGPLASGSLGDPAEGMGADALSCPSQLSTHD